MKLRIAGFAAESIVDGPGIRLSVFAQGCSHRCPGCHNPRAQDPRGGAEMSVEEVYARIEGARGIDGVTFSGGEPFEQTAPLAVLAKCLPALGLNLVLYSGYTFEELQYRGKEDKDVQCLLKEGWLLVDGPFILARRSIQLPYRGSSNQRILDLPRSLDASRPVEWKADRADAG